MTAVIIEHVNVYVNKVVLITYTNALNYGYDLKQEHEF